jgi:hypothetical protein
MEVSDHLQGPVSFLLGKIELHYPLNKTLAGSRAGLDAMQKRRIPGSCWDSNPESLVILLLA